MIELRSDNAAGAAPEIVAAVTAANTGSALAYGGDPWTIRLRELVATVFEHPDVTVFPVTSGTAANALSIATLCPPWGAVLCHETAHILRNEGGATSMFAAGAVMRGLPGDGYRISPEALEHALATTNWGDPHQSQPSVLSLTLPTDFGTIYTPDMVAELTGIARVRGLRTHLDGARIANAIAALGCAPSELTWRAGIDVISLGAIKNGGINADAIVCFDSSLAKPLEYRLKRAGHIASKMRFQAAQLDTYLTDDLWLRLARASNAAMERLAAGLTELGVELLAPVQVNMAFARLEDRVCTALEDQGLLFYRLGGGVARFVTSFNTSFDEIDAALEVVGSALAGDAGAADRCDITS
jgi:threonine aldolase